MNDYIELNKKNTEIIIKETTDAKLKQLKKNRYSIQLAMLSSYVDKSKSLLDIGIRDGAFLVWLEEQGFTDVYGIDIYERSIKIAKSKGIKCEIADVHTMDLGRKFSAVIMSHVLEHCPYPDKVLKNVYNHMNEKGVLFIEVPIEQGDPKPTEKDAHYFNFHSVEELLVLLKDKWEVLEKFATHNRIKIVARRL